LSHAKYSGIDSIKEIMLRITPSIDRSATNQHLPLLRSKPPNSILNSITRLLNRLATPISLKRMPMHRQMLAAVRLNNTNTKMNLRKDTVPPTRPTM